MIIIVNIINIFKKMNSQQEFVEDEDTYYIYDNKPITDEIIEQNTSHGMKT